MNAERNRRKAAYLTTLVASPDFQQHVVASWKQPLAARYEAALRCFDSSEKEIAFAQGVLHALDLFDGQFEQALATLNAKKGRL